jgi:hypothetical protein
MTTASPVRRLLGSAGGGARRARPAAIAALLCLALGACGDDPLRHAELRDTLRRKREQWEARRPPGYEFEFRWKCFCGPPLTELVLVTVVDDEIREASFLASGEPVPESDLDEFRTVDGLFAFLEDAIEESAFAITAEFDSALGYPRDAWVDFEELAVDEERGFACGPLRAVP